MCCIRAHSLHLQTCVAHLNGLTTTPSCLLDSLSVFVVHGIYPFQRTPRDSHTGEGEEEEEAAAAGAAREARRRTARQVVSDDDSDDDEEEETQRAAGVGGEAEEVRS
jgi:hypothetical protein